MRRPTGPSGRRARGTYVCRSPAVNKIFWRLAIVALVVEAAGPRPAADAASDGATLSSCLRLDIFGESSGVLMCPLWEFHDQATTCFFFSDHGKFSGSSKTPSLVFRAPWPAFKVRSAPFSHGEPRATSGSRALRLGGATTGAAAPTPRSPPPRSNSRSRRADGMLRGALCREWRREPRDAAR